VVDRDVFVSTMNLLGHFVLPWLWARVAGRVVVLRGEQSVLEIGTETEIDRGLTWVVRYGPVAQERRKREGDGCGGTCWGDCAQQWYLPVQYCNQVDSNHYGCGL
jgi:hypothetical protein